jgi:FkbM family methyltransferase
MIRHFMHQFRRRWAARRLRLGPPIVQTDFMGCKILVRPQEEVGRSVALGEFEIADLQHFVAAIGNGDVVFDIGANIGAYCVSIGRARPGAQVHAFEPIDLNGSLIQVSLHLNRLNNVQLVRKCVSDSAGRVEFSLAEDSAYSSMIDTGRKAELRRFICDTVALDQYCEEQGHVRPGLVKIDVEGAELKVLQGATQLFADPSRRPRLVLIELYDQNLAAFGTSIDEVTAWMTARGYDAYVLIDRVPVPFAHEHHNKIYNVFFALR